MNEELDKVKEKIRRLLALAEHPNSNIHEASQAAAKASELMFKYNISEAAIPSEQKGKEQYIRQKYDLGRGKDIAWKRDLWMSLCRWNFCKGYYMHTRDSRGHLHRTPDMDIIGEPHNIEFVKYLMEYLSTEIKRLSEVLWISDGYGSSRTWKTQFCYGAVAGVDGVLREKYYSQLQAAVQTQALVVIKDKELLEAQGRIIGKLGRPVNMSGAKVNQFSWHQGLEEGSKIQINRPLSETQTKGYLE